MKVVGPATFFVQVVVVAVIVFTGEYIASRFFGVRWAVEPNRSIWNVLCFSPVIVPILFNSWQMRRQLKKLRQSERETST